MIKGLMCRLGLLNINLLVNYDLMKMLNHIKFWITV